MNKLTFQVIILFTCFFTIEASAQLSQKEREKSGINKSRKQTTLKMTISPQVVELIGAEASKFLASADQLHLYTVDYSRDTSVKDITQTHILGYKIRSKADSIPPTTLPALQNIMLSSASYYWDSFAKSCVFTPYVAAVFGNTKSKEQFVVLYCFSCDEWEFHFKGKTLREDSDLARRQLLHQFKAALKDTKTLQSLN